MVNVTEDDSGVRHGEVVNWYLKEMENEIESEAELIERKTLVEKVIYRLVHHVSREVLARFLTNLNEMNRDF